MNIITALPGIAPEAREYVIGEWPQNKMKMRNGRVQRWGLASAPNGDTMSLTWKNITYAQAENLCSIWDSSYGVCGELKLPPEIFAGTSGGLGELMAQSYYGATWHFSGPPEVSSVKAGRCTVRMQIYTRGPSTYAP